MTMANRGFRPGRWALALWFISACSTAAATNNLHFSGNLVAGACTLVVQGNHLADVVFPKLSAGDLALAPSAFQPFSFQLTDCSTALSNGVRVTFSGVEAAGLAGFLALDGSSTASGVGIGIATLPGTAVAINSGNATFTLTSGNNTLNLQARVQAIPGAEIVPGHFSASATATFEYL